MFDMTGLQFSRSIHNRSALCCVWWRFGLGNGGRKFHRDSVLWFAFQSRLPLKSLFLLFFQFFHLREIPSMARVIGEIIAPKLLVASSPQRVFLQKEKLFSFPFSRHPSTDLESCVLSLLCKHHIFIVIFMLLSFVFFHFNFFLLFAFTSFYSFTQNSSARCGSFCAERVVEGEKSERGLSGREIFFTWNLCKLRLLPHPFMSRTREVLSLTLW